MADHSPSTAPESLAAFRFTRQRREVYDALLQTSDHPSAVQVFRRVQERMPAISLATVYNCLETLVQHGLARQVNLDRGATRFCANQRRHGHFFCSRCGGVRDVDLPEAADLARVWQLADDFVVTHYEFSLRGLCPDCAAASPIPNPS